MTAFQETEQLSFGSARLFGTDASGNVLVYGQLTDISIDFKTDLKEAFGEQSYPFAVADGHKTIDITGKYYLLQAQGFADAVGGGAIATTEAVLAIDEQQAVSSHSATLNNAPTGIWTVIGNVGGAPVYYVQAGSAVAGVSYSRSGAVLTFASGDAVTSITATYAYTAGSATGASFAVVGGFQNSQPFQQLDAIRRDASRVDSSTAIQHFSFGRVRQSGVKMPYKEGDFAVYEVSFKAYADPFGNVFTYTRYNV